MQTNAISNIRPVISHDFAAIKEIPSIFEPLYPIPNEIYAMTRVMIKTNSRIFARLIESIIFIVFSSYAFSCT